MPPAREDYPTPDKLTRYLLWRVPSIADAERVYEPCAGDGAIANVLRSIGVPLVATNDVDPEMDTDFHLDATKPSAWLLSPRPEWIVTNPPYSLAPQIIRAAMASATVGIAFLLRLNFLEPCGPRGGDRGKWLRENQGRMQDLIVFGDPRPSFTGDGRTDSITTCWAVFTKERRLPPKGTRVWFANDWQDI